MEADLAAAPRNVICLVIDRLHAGMLGPYGNTWVRTPNFNRLAAESLLFDQALVDVPELDRLYRSYWQGLHACQPDSSSDALPGGTPDSLPRQLTAAGYETLLCTDEPAIAEHPLASFDDARLVDFEPATIANDLAETHLARFFAATLDLLQSRLKLSSAPALADCASQCHPPADCASQCQPPVDSAIRCHRPLFCWLHTGCLGRVWDAPPEFSKQYAVEDDPAPPEVGEVPCRRLPRDFDPDELLGIVHAYAGQISLLDACLGLFLDELRASPLAANTLLVVLGARGFPLGEHGQVGPVDEALHGELVQIPWLIRFPDGFAASVRSSDLVQPADLHATLLQWCGLQPPAATPLAGNLLSLAQPGGAPIRDRACLGNRAGERAIRTANWFLRLAGDLRQLYFKPEDRFEVNEVANRCPEVVAALEAALAEFEQAAGKTPALPFPPLAPLPEILSADAF